MIFDDIESLLKEYKQVQILEVPFNPVDPIFGPFKNKNVYQLFLNVFSVKSKEP